MIQIGKEIKFTTQDVQIGLVLGGFGHRPKAVMPLQEKSKRKMTISVYSVSLTEFAL